MVTIVEGPGTGNSFAIYSGDNAIGRGPQNRIELNFGDETIHREPHAWINAEEKSFIVQYGGKTNPVHVNGRRVEGIHSLAIGDRISKGQEVAEICDVFGEVVERVHATGSGIAGLIWAHKVVSTGDPIVRYWITTPA